MQSIDLPVVAQEEMQKITDQHMAERAAAGRKIEQSLRIFMLGILLIAITNYLLNRYVVPDQVLSAPVVVMSMVSAPDNPLLCPGDTLAYALSLDIIEPAVVSIDWSVRNLDTGITEIPSPMARAIYEEPGVVNVRANWVLPLILPATNVLPLRHWQPGQYRRLIALTGVEGDKAASVVTIDFRIKPNCVQD